MVIKIHQCLHLREDFLNSDEKCLKLNLSLKLKVYSSFI